MPGLTSRSVAWPLAASSILAAVAVAWPPDQYVYRGDQRRVYGAETWWLLVLLWAGTIAVVAGPALLRATGAAVAAVSALQLAGTGIVAHRRWFTSGGFGGRATNETTLRGLAILLALVSVLIVVACVVVLVTDGAIAIPGRASNVAPAVLVGVAVVVAVPLGMGWEDSSNRTTQGGAHALMYGIPWGLAICGSAFLRLRERLAAVASLALSAAPLFVSEPMIPGDDVRLAPIVLIAALVLTTPMPGQTPTVASSRNSAVSDVGRSNP